jgi:hypothetical protein
LRRPDPNCLLTHPRALVYKTRMSREEQLSQFAAHGFSAKKDLLAQLLELNLSVAHRLENAEPVTPPGIPATFPNPETLISDDCIRPPAMSGAAHTGRE